MLKTSLKPNWSNIVTRFRNLSRFRRVLIVILVIIIVNLLSGTIKSLVNHTSILDEIVSTFIGGRYGIIFAILVTLIYPVRMDKE